MIDETLARKTIVYAAIAGATGVIAGSFGAHGLESFLADQGYSPELINKRLVQFNTGVRYHMYHAVALIALAAIPFGSPLVRRWVGRFLIAGIVLFSGSLYILVFANEPKFGMVTPFGGLCWIIGWSGLVGLTFRHKYQADDGSTS